MYVRVLKPFTRGDLLLAVGAVVELADAVAEILIADRVAEETDAPAPAPAPTNKPNKPAPAAPAKDDKPAL